MSRWQTAWYDVRILSQQFAAALQGLLWLAERTAEHEEEMLLNVAKQNAVHCWARACMLCYSYPHAPFPAPAAFKVADDSMRARMAHYVLVIKRWWYDEEKTTSISQDCTKQIVNLHSANNMFQDVCWLRSSLYEFVPTRWRPSAYFTIQNFCFSVLFWR